jgi:SRSO17 transposase
MNRREIDRLDRELGGFIDSMVDGMGRPERRRAMGAYITGLLLDGERKSVQPMAARLVDEASEVEAMRQRLQQAVCVSPWSDAELGSRLAQRVDRELPAVEAFVVDDTGFPKKGTHSVGVARQYSGTLGRVDNCQVAVSVHLAGELGSACIGMRLFLPEAWAADVARRRSVGIPTEIEFAKKWQLALALIDDALAAGVRRHVVLADPGYGDSTEFRDRLTERQLPYVVGVMGNHCIWLPGVQPIVPPREPSSPGAPRTRAVATVEPMSIERYATELGLDNYRRVTWREGSRGKQSSRFVAVRIRSAERRTKGRAPGNEEWLLCEWPDGEAAPTKFYLSSLPATTSLKALVRAARLRWRVERDYQELKQEIGLDHFEGRTWRGFHHHATLCAVAHAFLALQRALFPPEETDLDTAGGATAASAGAFASDRDLSAL